MTRNDWLGGTLGVIAAFLVALPLTVQILFGLQVLDVVSGLIAAAREGKVSSNDGKKGLLKKLGVWAVLIGIYLIQQILPPDIWPQIGQVAISPFVGFAGLYAGMEFVSVLENAERAGVDIGPLRPLIRRLEVSDDDVRVKPT